MRELIVSNTDLEKISSRVLLQGGSFSFTAKGNSMRPFLQDGDVLTVAPTDTANLQTGDVVLYRNQTKRLIVHRIIKRSVHQSMRLLLIRADAQPKNQDYIYAEQVLGKVTHAYRGTREIQLNNWLYRSASLLWIKTTPVSSFLYFLPGRLLKYFIRGILLYRSEK